MGYVILAIGVIAFAAMVVLSSWVRGRRRIKQSRVNDYRPEEMDVQSRPPFM